VAEAPTASVLIVEDDDQVRSLLASWCRAHGYVVLNARDCGSGIALALAHMPAAIVLDLKLPDRHGIELLRALDAARANIPSVVLSGDANASDGFEAARLGAVEFIEKPADEASVMLAIARALQRTGGDHAVARRPAVVRVAMAIVQSREAPDDFPTLDQWARTLATSRGGLKARCEMAKVLAHVALECARLLRAFDLSFKQGGDPIDYLDISDSRTGTRLLFRAGFSTEVQGLPAVEFMRVQRLILDDAIREAVVQMLER